jgi:malonyl-CoA O-methyltransferase
MIFDKSIIKSNFNRFAQNYSQKADLQKQVANNLFSLAKEEFAKSSSIIDLGCGSGFILNNLKINTELQGKDIFQLDIALNMLRSNDNAGFNINGDIEMLPFLSNSFDLILSSLAFQWIGDLSGALSKIRNILKPNSPLIFSVFLDGTLMELLESKKITDVDLCINDFIRYNELENALSSNFSNYTISTQDFSLQYEDIYVLLRSIKDVGASYSYKDLDKKPFKKKAFEDINAFYLKNFNIHGKLEGSWKVAYVKAYS